MPFEIPESWEWVKLDELAQYKKGPFGSSLTKAMFVKEGVDTFKVYEQKNAIQKDSTIGTYYISKEHFERLNAFEVQPNDIIVSCAGTIGETYILPKDIKRGVINQALMFVRLYLPIITPFYLIYFDFIIKSSSQQDSKGTAIKNIPPFEILKNYLFPLPPLQEQERIIAGVEKWFTLIDNIEDCKRDIQETIKATKNKILDMAVHGKLVPQDPNDEPAVELLKRINPAIKPCDTSHYENLPKGWCSATIKQLCDVMGGLWTGKKPPYVNVGVIRNTNFSKDFKLDLTNVAYLDVERHQYEKRKLQYGDLILEKSGGSDKQPVGRVILYDNEEGDFSYSNFTSRLRIKDPSVIIPQFLFYALLYAYLNGETQSMQKQTTGIHNLIMDKYLSVSVPVPPINEQNRIVQKIQKIEGKIREISAEL